MDSPPLTVYCLAMSEPVSQPSRKQNQERMPEWWPIAQALRIQGLKPKAIATELGVNYESLRKRFQRAGMSQVDKHIEKAVISKTVTITQQANAAAQVVAERSLRSRLHEINRNLLESPPLKRKPKTLDQAEQVARITNTVTQSTKLQEGWSDQPNCDITVKTIASSTGLDAAIKLGLIQPPKDPANPVPSGESPQSPVIDVPAIATDSQGPADPSPPSESSDPSGSQGQVA